jgi:hypothetical protein
MNSSRRSIVSSLWALLFWTSATMLTAQSTNTPELNCFKIRVSLNGNLIDGPAVITLRTKQNESIVPLERGCFRVPLELFSEEKLDVLFTLPGNKIHLAAISTGFFTDSWDIDLDDKSFTKRRTGLPKHVRSGEVCQVSFRGGEPERGIFQTGCRTPSL